MPSTSPHRHFAIDVVRRLQAAGFEALFAGGCVRDEIMGHTPSDYDVATNARPDQVRGVFGSRHTLAIGQAFGVIAVRDSRGGGVVEVATFRQDGPYSDGRHPDAVEFSDAEHDAQRRDFTINGLFLDPLRQQVFDYVGGVTDIQTQTIRAIGEPAARFAEDHLRLLRAPRFAARLHFTIEPRTLTAIQSHAAAIQTVAAERVGNEMRMMLDGRSAAAAFDWLVQTSLWRWTAPTLWPDPAQADSALATTRDVLARLAPATFECALAALIWGLAATPLPALHDVATRWKLSNHEVDHVGWLVGHVQDLACGATVPWPNLQRLLIHPWAADGIALATALVGCASWTYPDLQFSRERLRWPVAQLNPPPLLDGHDLKDLGIAQGPIYSKILWTVRDQQLLGVLQTRDQALAVARELGRGPPAGA